MDFGSKRHLPVLAAANKTAYRLSLFLLTILCKSCPACTETAFIQAGKTAFICTYSIFQEGYPLFLAERPSQGY